MNFLFLSPYFPVNYMSFSVQLGKLGAKVLGVGDAAYDSLDLKLKSALREYYYVHDLHYYDQLRRACEHFIQRYGKLDRIDSLSEYWLETEAQLRTEFGIPGLQNDVIQAMKRKSLMKHVFAEAGVDVIQGRICHNLKEALSLIQDVGFPMIAKPDIGVGANLTYKINNRKQLEDFFSKKPPQEFIFEEYVAGELFSFDGLTDRDGNLCFFTGNHFSKGIMDIVQQDEDIYYYIMRKIPPDLEEAGKKVLKAFNVKERFFHLEFFRRHDTKKLVALEVNMRPCGGWTTDMFNYANDMNIYHEWANVMINNRFDATWNPRYYVMYIGRKNRLPYLHTHEAVIHRYKNILCHQAPNPDVYAPALGNYGYILRAHSLEELMDAADYTLKQGK